MSPEERTPSIARILGHRAVFLSFLAINLAIPFCTHFYPTLDGPAHLYNAQLLKQYAFGNEVVRAHLELTPHPVPNWLDHGLLAVLLCVLPAWLAEKALICLYIGTMALGFRALIRIAAPANTAMSLLVFPLVQNELFNFGFYNFSLGLALMLCTLALHWEPQERWNWRWTSRLLLLVTLACVCNVLAFATAMFAMGMRVLLLVWHGTRDGLPPLAIRERHRSWITGMIIAFIPGCLFFLAFNSATRFLPAEFDRPIPELLQWLVDSKPIISFGYAAERPVAMVFSLVLAVLIILRFRSRGPSGTGAGAIITTCTALLIAYLTVPDSYSAGMMCDRFGLLFLVLFAAWLGITSTPGKWPHGLAFTGALVSLGLAGKHWGLAQRDLDGQAQAVHGASAVIAPNSTVYPVILSDNWLHKHISNYLGADKPMIILENYEARLGWFPLRWREGRPAQRCMAGPVPYGVRCDTSMVATPDNVVLIGDTSWMSRPDWSALRSELRAGYDALPMDQGFVAVYRRKP